MHLSPNPVEAVHKFMARRESGKRNLQGRYRHLSRASRAQEEYLTT